MDPLGVGDTHLSKKKANNPMFSHTTGQSSNASTRKQYYEGSSTGLNKYTMTMGNPSSNANMQNNFDYNNNGEMNQNYPSYGGNIPSSSNNPNNPNYKPSGILGKNFLKPRYNGSPPTQPQPTTATHYQKKSIGSSKSLNSSMTNLSSSASSLYSHGNVNTPNALQNQHFYASSPNLTTNTINNGQLNTIQPSKSIHDYGIFSKVKKERPKLPQEQITGATDVIDFSDFISDPNHVPLECVSLPALANSSSSQNLNKGDNSQHIFNPSMNQTVMTSSWLPPDSWDVKLDETMAPMKENISEQLGNQGHNEFSNSNQELSLIHNGSVKDTEPFQTPEDIYYDSHYSNVKVNEDQKNNYIRVFKTDLTFTTVMCYLNSNADQVCKKVAAKFFINDYNKYNLVVIRNKLERIIKPNEYPLLMQKRWLERLGYTSLDKLDLQGREDNSYCYRFIFKEIQIGREISPDYWKLPEIKDNPHVNLAGFGLTILPVYLFQNAPEIISLDLSRNLNIQELHSDLTPSLTSLKSLSLSHNRIHNFPRNIHCITTLTHINLSFNRIRTLEHTGIEHLKNLLVLELQCNLIEDIPEALAKGCQRLQYISLSNNRIKSIPVSFFHNLRRVLRHLDISFNRLVGNLPPEISELEVLEILRLNGNHMDGDIPKRLSECLQLRELDLRGNRFGSIMTYDQDGTEILTETENYAQTMEVLSECKKLEILLLDGNPIRWIGKMSAVEDAQYEMSANIDPSKFIDFPVLKKFSMSYRLSTGNQKPMVFRITNITGTLTELNLSFCGLEILPNNFFTKLTGIERLILDGNRLRELPNFSSSVHVHQKEIRQIGPFRMRHLSIYYNHLMALPDDIGELVELEYLDVRSNHLKTFPDSIWQCGKLRSINATSNQLEQFPIPINDENDATSVKTGMSEATLVARRQRRMTTNISIQAFPPLSFSLLALFLADNHLTEDLCLALFFMPNLVVLNASYNDISDITAWFDCAPPTPLVEQPSYAYKSSRAQASSTWFSHLQELYLSGNNIITLPGEIEKLRNLTWLFLDNNKLSTIPGEVAKLNKLCAFDVGGQGGGRGEGSGLRYNINNWPYDWNWSWNLELKYLNLSGNKRLEITPNAHNQKLIPFDKDNKRLMGSTNKIDLPSRHQAAGYGLYENDLDQSQSMNISISQRKSLSNFTTLTNLSMLGLMDVTCLMVQIPDENDQRRIRTTSSEIPQTGVPGGIIKYGISDTLCRFASETTKRESLYISREQANNVRDSTYFANTAIGVIPKEKYFLGIWDVVIPQFRNMDNEALFGIFDGRGTEDGTKLAEYLFRLFAGDFQVELKKVEESLIRERNHMKPYSRNKEPIVLDPNSIKSAIRRTFLGLNKELGEKFRTSVSNKNRSEYNKNFNEDNDDELFGCSAVIVYMVGDRKKETCSLYVANVGDGTCILSKAGGNAQVISRSFKVGNVMDWASSRVYDQNQKVSSSSLSTYSLENHRVLQQSVNSSQGSLAGNVYTSSNSDSPKFIAGLGDEMERIQNAGGWITSDGLVNGKTDVTRAFGYFNCLGSLNASPWIVKMELDFGDNNQNGTGIHLTSESDKHDEEAADIKLKLGNNHSDEFLVLTNGAVLDAIRCGADANNNETPGFSLCTLDDTAQIIVDIARSALGNESSKRNKGTYQYQGISKNARSTTGWGAAATKIRDVALSHGAYGARTTINANQKVKSSKGMMVMVLGLRDLVETAQRWIGARRGSTETGSDSLELMSLKRRGSDAAIKMGKRKDGELSIPPSIEPPTGQLALVFTDIKNSTALWETHAIAMRNSIKLHNMRMRALLKQYGGYEVKTDGDSFMVSFVDLMSAVQWCLDVQTELIKIDWPPEILESEDGEEIWWDTINGEPVYDDEYLDDEDIDDDIDDDLNDDDEDNLIYQEKEDIPLETRIAMRKKNSIALLFRGLCVRMGIHYGTPLCEMDPTTGRMDYFGPMVNRASRICSAAQGGQIFISSEVVREITKRKGGDPSLIRMNNTLDEKIADSMNIKTWIIGEKKLKGLETPEVLHCMYPKQYYLRHDYFTWMQNQKQESTNNIGNLMDIRMNPIDINSLKMNRSSEPTRIDRNYVQTLGNLCLRLEFLAVNAQNICFNNQNFDERIPVYPYLINSSSISIPIEATEKELTAALEGIAIRIENAVSILTLIQSSPLNRILKTLGSYIDVSPNQILTALQEYVLAMKERDERLERIRNERRERERRIKNRASKAANTSI
ncbi:L domain-like protein [Piromyces finnis]|uniref:Adenylate cyclase n=1 Tax=Piromyces finnis TaxID=1754191 RepID=A0A1Y1VDC0_9FUNG|nr:L domain-like protein [Piromyces finnis]|eukprot:ORX53399.1 L domain-like protein [Piromyces finnis]